MIYFVVVDRSPPGSAPPPVKPPPLPPQTSMQNRPLPPLPAEASPAAPSKRGIVKNESFSSQRLSSGEHEEDDGTMRKPKRTSSERSAVRPEPQQPQSASSFRERPISQINAQPAIARGPMQREAFAKLRQASAASSSSPNFAGLRRKKIRYK